MGSQTFYKLPAIIVVLIACSTTFADLFPYDVGYRWEFDFNSNASSGLDGSTLDSGTIVLEVMDITRRTQPPQTLITIERTRSLEKRVYTLQIGICRIDSTVDPPVIICDPVGPIDTVYNPPIVTVDTLLVINASGSNGYTISPDTCWSFINDETVPGTDSMVDLRRTKFYYRGDSVDAFSVNPLPCRDKSPDSIIVLPRNPIAIFTLAHGLGPVAYSYASAPIMIDFYYTESWSLTYTNADGRSGVGGRSISFSRSAWKAEIMGNRLFFQLSQDAVLSAEAVRMDGSRIPLLPEKHYAGGSYFLELDPSLQGQMCILRVRMDGEIASQLIRPRFY